MGMVEECWLIIRLRSSRWKVRHNTWSEGLAAGFPGVCSHNARLLLQLHVCLRVPRLGVQSRWRGTPIMLICSTCHLHLISPSPFIYFFILSFPKCYLEERYMALAFCALLAPYSVSTLIAGYVVHAFKWALFLCIFGGWVSLTVGYLFLGPAAFTAFLPRYITPRPIVFLPQTLTSFLSLSKPRMLGSQNIEHEDCGTFPDWTWPWVYYHSHVWSSQEGGHVSINMKKRTEFEEIALILSNLHSWFCLEKQDWKMILSLMASYQALSTLHMLWGKVIRLKSTITIVKNILLIIDGLNK